MLIGLAYLVLEASTRPIWTYHFITFYAHFYSLSAVKAIHLISLLCHAAAEYVLCECDSYLDFFHLALSFLHLCLLFSVAFAALPFGALPLRIVSALCLCYSTLGYAFAIQCLAVPTHIISMPSLRLSSAVVFPGDLLANVTAV